MNHQAQKTSSSREPLLKRADYEAALKSYGGRGVILILTEFPVFVTLLFAIIWAVKNLFPQVWNFSEDRFDDGIVGRIAVFSTLLASMVPAVFLLVFGLRRLRNQPGLRCPACDGEIASDRAQKAVLYSSYCPWCETKLLANEERKRVKKPYETLRKEMLGHVRFTTVALGLATPVIVGSVYVTLSTRPNPAGIGELILTLTVATLMPAMLCALMWHATRRDLKRAKWLIELNERE